MNSRKRRKRVRRKKTRSKKIIKGGAKQWKGFTLDSGIERELEIYLCPYAKYINMGIKFGNPTSYFFGPNYKFAGVVQYQTSISQLVEGQTLITINYLCCWFSKIDEQLLTEGYSAGQIMMAMIILTLFEQYKNFKIQVIAAKGSELYYKSCGFVDTGGNVFTYEIKPDLDIDLDMETILSKFTKNYAPKKRSVVFTEEINLNR